MTSIRKQSQRILPPTNRRFYHPQKPSLERYQYKKRFLVFLNSDPFAERDYDCVRENSDIDEILVKFRDFFYKNFVFTAFKLTKKTNLFPNLKFILYLLKVKQVRIIAKKILREFWEKHSDCGSNN